MLSMFFKSRSTVGDLFILQINNFCCYVAYRPVFNVAKQNLNFDLLGSYEVFEKSRAEPLLKCRFLQLEMKKAWQIARLFKFS